MVIQKIETMLRKCASTSPSFPPTKLYNEGWLLRLILDWFSANKVDNHSLAFTEGVEWFSEALLPTAFPPKRRGHSKGEAWTHADGVIGHFTIGHVGKADLSLSPSGTHFIVLEAKMFSKLSAGVTHAKYFDQAARTVACMAEVLKRASRQPSKLSGFGLYVLAPDEQISRGIFEEEMDKNSINTKVHRRVLGYGDGKDSWFSDWFIPSLKHIQIDCMSWESLLEEIERKDSSIGTEMQGFYSYCMRFNRPESKSESI